MYRMRRTRQSFPPLKEREREGRVYLVRAVRMTVRDCWALDWVAWRMGSVDLVVRKRSIRWMRSAYGEEGASDVVGVWLLGVVRWDSSGMLGRDRRGGMRKYLISVPGEERHYSPTFSDEPVRLCRKAEHRGS